MDQHSLCNFRCTCDVDAFGEHQDIFMGHVQWINILYVISGVHVMLLRLVKCIIFLWDTFKGSTCHFYV